MGNEHGYRCPLPCRAIDREFSTEVLHPFLHVPATIACTTCTAVEAPAIVLYTYNQLPATGTYFRFTGGRFRILYHVIDRFLENKKNILPHLPGHHHVIVDC